MTSVRHLIHQQLHEKALYSAREYLRFEAELIGILQELDRNKTYLHFQMPSLFAYTTKLLHLSQHIALTLIGIARKSIQVPELKAAIEEKKITISNARRIAPILNSENKRGWIEKAATLSQAKLECELAKSFPEKPSPTKIKYKTESSVRLEVDLQAKTLEKLKRVQEILSQKKQAHIGAASTLDLVLDEFIEKHDPIQRAQRAIQRVNFSNEPDKHCVVSLLHHANSPGMVSNLHLRNVRFFPSPGALDGWLAARSAQFPATHPLADIHPAYLQ